MIPLVGLLLCASLTFAQTTDLTLVKTLRPPGSENNSSLTNVALAGDTAITAYWSRDQNCWQVWYRNPVDGLNEGWSEPTLLAEIEPVPTSTPILRMSANGPVLAIGLPNAEDGAGEIRMYRTGDNGMTWQLQSVIASPEGNRGFGDMVMVRGDLLVEATSGTPAVHSYKAEEDDGWVPADWSVTSIPTAGFSVATDGERIAFCSTRCTTRVRDVNSQWVIEAQTETFDAGHEIRDVQVSGEWLIGDRNAYRRQGSIWQQVQYFYHLSDFVLDEESMLIHDPLSWNLNIWRPNGSIWEVVANLDKYPSFRYALSGDRALADTQSFLDSDGGWLASGSIHGRIEPDVYRFGEALAIHGGELRIGTPGSNRIDRAAGASLAYSLGGSSIAPLRAAVVAPGHVIEREFGSGLASGDGRLIASSREGDDGTGTVWIFDENDKQLLQHLVLPESGARAGGLAQLDGTLAVGEMTYGPGTVWIYQHDVATGFELGQTLVGDEADASAGFGLKVVLRGDWLATGDVLFHRSGPGSDFTRIRRLETPNDVGFIGESMAAKDGILIGVSINPKWLAFVYRFDESNGWELIGEVPREPPFDQGEDSCWQFAVLQNAAACVVRHDGGQLDLVVMRPQAGTSDWRVADVLPIDRPEGDNSAVFRMVGSGSYVALGLPDSDVGGPDDTSYVAGGRVLVFLTGEAIFSDGFE